MHHVPAHAANRSSAYIKRMEELESIAKGFTGVEQAFAIQAGRELRVIASSRETTDQSPPKSAAILPTPSSSSSITPAKSK